MDGKPSSTEQGRTAQFRWWDQKLFNKKNSKKKTFVLNHDRNYIVKICLAGGTWWEWWKRISVLYNFINQCHSSTFIPFKYSIFMLLFLFYCPPKKNYGHHIKSIVGLLSPSFWVFSFKCECVPFSLCCDCEHLNVNSDSHTLPKPKKKTWNACIINCYPPCTNQKKTIRKSFARLFFLSLFHHQFVCFFSNHLLLFFCYTRRDDDSVQYISIIHISVTVCCSVFDLFFFFPASSSLVHQLSLDVQYLISFYSLTLFLSVFSLSVCVTLVIP